MDSLCVTSFEEGSDRLARVYLRLSIVALQWWLLTSLRSRHCLGRGFVALILGHVAQFGEELRSNVADRELASTPFQTKETVEGNQIFANLRILVITNEKYRKLSRTNCTFSRCSLKHSFFFSRESASSCAFNETR